MLNPIQYISRTYSDIISDLNTDTVISKLPEFFKTPFAGIFNLLNSKINLVANEVLPSRVSARDIAQDLFESLGYPLKGYSESSCLLELVIDASATSGGSYTIPKSDLKFTTQAQINKPLLQFISLADVTFPISTTSKIFTVYQRTEQANIGIGTTDGADSQRFYFQDTGIIPSTVVITVNGIPYTKVDNFALSTSADKHFVFYTCLDNTSYIELGFTDVTTGNQYGFIPASGLSVVASYSITQGVNSNTAIDTITVYTGTDANVVSCSNNAEAATGGANPENIEYAKKMIPIYMETHGMAWDNDTVQYLASRVPGVYIAISSKIGENTCNVYIMPNGGGTANNTLLLAVSAYLQTKSYFDTMTYTAYSVTYVSQTIIVTYTTDGTPDAQINKYVLLLIAYRSSEMGKAIYEDYKSNGIDSALVYINLYLSGLTGITYTTSDYFYINKILNKVKYNDLGSVLDFNDITSPVMEHITGVTYCNIVTMNIPALSNGEVLQPNTIQATKI